MKVQKFRQIFQYHCLHVTEQHKISWSSIPLLVSAGLNSYGICKLCPLYICYTATVTVVPSSTCRTTTLTKSNQYEHSSSLLDVEIKDLDQYVLCPLNQSQDSKKHNN